MRWRALLCPRRRAAAAPRWTRRRRDGSSWCSPSNCQLHWLIGLPVQKLPCALLTTPTNDWLMKYTLSSTRVQEL